MKKPAYFIEIIAFGPGNSYKFWRISGFRLSNYSIERLM